MEFMKPDAFKDNARKAIADENLQSAMTMLNSSMIPNRQGAVDNLPEFNQLSHRGRELKDHILANLDFYLERFERNCRAAGGRVHWCSTTDEARAAVLEICRSVDARLVTKGKSMIGEEIAINDHLEANGIEPIETDLGEYIIQLRNEPPSHIIAPATHVSKEQVADAFRLTHSDLDPARNLDEPDNILAEARAMLRNRYLEADVGITGANFLVAETGTSIFVTNEGNGDLTQTLPRVHIVLASLSLIHI